MVRPMEQNISSCSQGEEKRILVLSMSSKYDDGFAYGISPSRCYTLRAYHYAEFFLVDLNLGELVPDYAPSMLQFAGPSSVVALDNYLYIYGGRSPESEEPCHLELLSHPPKSHQKVFLGSSRLRLDMVKDGWCPVPKPVENSHYPYCISLFNKAYVYGSGERTPEVLDSKVGCWKPFLPLPSVLVDCVVSFYPLPDPSNNRILFHFSGGSKLTSPSVYAAPTDGGGTWKLIARDFFDWIKVAAVVDDVIYFNCNYFDGVLRAFDIESGEWLKVHWASKFEKGVNMNKARMDFDALLPLGDKVLCLAGWSPDDDSDGCRISFLKFRVERSGSTVNLIPLSSHSFVLPATRVVQNFIPL
ncbi:hypothetical protein RND81_12G001300 [Saponaria officinalis]|uniref:Uncharacterized protein n=1 Tax=Saponaria officinalis TaxID=3572 RepID=A0AAW1H4D8_SAPOF